MSTKQHLKHLAWVVVTAAAPVLIVMLTDSKWGHAAWAAPAIMLLRWIISANSGGPPVAGFAIALALLLSVSNCATFPTVVKCFGADVDPAIVTEIWADVASGNDSDLVMVAAQVGWAVISCVIDQGVAKGKVSKEKANATRAAHIELR